MVEAAIAKVQRMPVHEKRECGIALMGSNQESQTLSCCTAANPTIESETGEAHERAGRICRLGQVPRRASNSRPARPEPDRKVNP